MPSVSVFDSIAVSEFPLGGLNPTYQNRSDSVSVVESVTLVLQSASEARIKTLVNDYALAEEGTLAVDRYFDAVMRDLAWTEDLIEVSTDTIFAGQTSTTLSAVAVKIVAVFFGGRQLDQISLRSLESFDPRWRDQRGEPVAYTTEGELTKTIRFYPTPDSDGTLTIFHTQIQVAVPQWLELPIAFEILSREYGRESNHRDDTFSQLCSQVSGLLLKMVR